MRNARSWRARMVFALIGVLLGVAGAYLWHAAQLREAWQAALAARPDASALPAQFSQRANDCIARAEAGHDVGALGELASLYHANGFLEPAERIYRVLITVDPVNAHWPHRLASLLATGGRLEEAVPFMQRAVELAPDYVPARLRWGDALLKTNHLDEAVLAYHGVLDRAPKDAYALLGLARVELERERWTAAREELQKAVAADPTFFGAQSLLASVYERLGNPQAAALARDRANVAGRFREAPDPWVDDLVEQCYDVYRLQVVASSARATGDFAAAVPPLQRAIRLEPDNAQSHRQLASVRDALGDPAAAQMELEKAIALEPTNTSAYLDLIALHKRNHDFEAARRVVAAGLEHADEKAGVYFEQGLLFLEAQELEKAVAAFAEARRLSPEKIDAYVQQAGTLMRLGREEEGLEALNAAVAREPDCAPALVFLSRYYVRHDDAEKAESWFQRARDAGATPTQLTELANEYREHFGRAMR